MTGVTSPISRVLRMNAISDSRPSIAMRRHDAQIAALRDDLESRCDPFPEELSEGDLIDQLGDVARARIAPHLRIITPPPIVAIHDDSRVRLSIAALRHYLECPLQGAARHALGMSEDDEDDEVDR